MVTTKSKPDAVVCPGRLVYSDVLQCLKSGKLPTPCIRDGKPVVMVAVEVVPYTKPAKIVYKCPVCGVKVTV